MSSHNPYNPTFLLPKKPPSLPFKYSTIPTSSSHPYSSLPTSLQSAAADGVKLWDLRKLRNFRTISPYDLGSPTSCVEFEFSGNYLAMAGPDVRVYSTGTVKAEWNCIKTLPDLSGTGERRGGGKEGFLGFGVLGFWGFWEIGVFGVLGYLGLGFRGFGVLGCGSVDMWREEGVGEGGVVIRLVGSL